MGSETVEDPACVSSPSCWLCLVPCLGFASWAELPWKWLRLVLGCCKVMTLSAIVWGRLSDEEGWPHLQVGTHGNSEFLVASWNGQEVWGCYSSSRCTSITNRRRGRNKQASKWSASLPPCVPRCSGFTWLRVWQGNELAAGSCTSSVTHSLHLCSLLATVECQPQALPRACSTIKNAH